MAAFWSAAGNKDIVAAKQEGLQAKMNEQLKWQDTHGDLACAMGYSKILWPEGIELVEKDHAGAAPWMMCTKIHCRRHGLVAMPMTGVGFFLILQRDVFAHCFPAGELVSSGIPVSSYSHFVGTPDGVNNVKELATTTFVQADACVFVPPGFAAALCFHNESGPRPHPKMSRSAPIHVETAMAVLVPVPVKKQLAALTPMLKAALLSWSTEEARDKTTQLWQHRKEFLASVLKFD